MPRPICTIAREIHEDWENVSPYAKPYLDVMTSLRSIEENYMYDSAKGIILYFLANASGWRGPKARAIKAELKAMVK